MISFVSVVAEMSEQVDGLLLTLAALRVRVTVSAMAEC